MTTLALHEPQNQAIALPEPRGGAIAIRLAELKDVPFIDQLQRKHARMVGWFPTKQIEGNIAKGKVLIAEEIHHGNHGTHGMGVESKPNPPSAHSASSAVKTPVGYCIASDKPRASCAIGTSSRSILLIACFRQRVASTM